MAAMMADTFEEKVIKGLLFLPWAGLLLLMSSLSPSLSGGSMPPFCEQAHGEAHGHGKELKLSVSQPHE